MYLDEMTEGDWDSLMVVHKAAKLKVAYLFIHEYWYIIN